MTRLTPVFVSLPDPPLPRASTYVLESSSLAIQSSRAQKSCKFDFGQSERKSAFKDGAS